MTEQETRQQLRDQMLEDELCSLLPGKLEELILREAPQKLKDALYIQLKLDRESAGIPLARAARTPREISYVRSMLTMNVGQVTSCTYCGYESETADKTHA